MFIDKNQFKSISFSIKKNFNSFRTLIVYADLNTCKLGRKGVTDRSWILQTSKT